MKKVATSVVLLLTAASAFASMKPGDFCGNRLKVYNDSGFVIKVNEGILSPTEKLLAPGESIDQCLLKMHKVSVQYQNPKTEQFETIPSCPSTHYYGLSSVKVTLSGENNEENRLPLCDFAGFIETIKPAQP